MLKNKKNIKKKKSYYAPTGILKKNANISDKNIYKKSQANPLDFWQARACELKWIKKWDEVAWQEKVGEREGAKFGWFKNAQLNITENCLDENVKTKPNKLAFIWEAEPIHEAPKSFTYKELADEVNKFSNALKNLGVKKGDRVGIYLPMLPEVIIAMLACSRIGAVHAVVFSAFSSNALKLRLQDTQAEVLITCDGYYRRGKVIDLKKSADEALPETNVNKVVVVKRANNPVDFQEGRDLWWHDLVENENTICPAEPMAAEDMQFILYTSGSTGKPKGTFQACGGYMVQAKATGKYIFDWKDSDIFFSTADIGWITGHTYSCYAPLLNRALFIIFEGSPDWPTPDRWANIIEKYGVTIFYTAPTAIRMFEKYGTDIIKKYKFETLRLLGSVGEPIDEDAWNWYFKEVGKEKCPIVDTWWQTETGGILISSLPGIGPFKPTFAGKPFPGINFAILDEKGKPVKAGEKGNLVIKKPFNPGLLRGIYKNPEKYFTTYWEQYGQDIYYTSDSALQDKNGLIRIVGRMDDVLKVAGHRFTTGELENAISLHIDITESAVVGKKDEIKGEVPIAFVVSKNKAKGEEDLKKEVMDLVRKQIGPIALPSEIYIVDELPKTRSGKIMRRILKKLFTGEELGDLSTLANPQSVEAIRKLI